MTNKPRVVRMSLDLDIQQKNFLRIFAAKNDISSAIVMRAMLYMLESDPDFANRVIDLIFSVPEEDVEYIEDDELDDGEPS